MAALVIPQGVDQLAFVHFRPASYSEFGRALFEFLFGPVLVILCGAALLGYRLATGLRIRDPRRLLFAGPFVA